MFLSAVFPRFSLVLDPEGRLGGKVGNVCEKFEDKPRVVYWVNVSEISGPAHWVVLDLTWVVLDKWPLNRSCCVVVVIRQVAVMSNVCYVDGWKCLNGSFTIQTNFDESSADLTEFAVEHRGWSSSSGELNFAKVFSSRTWSEKQHSGGVTYFQQLVESGVLFIQFLDFLHCSKQHMTSCLALRQTNTHTHTWTDTHTEWSQYRWFKKIKADGMFYLF